MHASAKPLIAALLLTLSAKAIRTQSPLPVFYVAQIPQARAMADRLAAEAGPGATLPVPLSPEVPEGLARALSTSSPRAAIALGPHAVRMARQTLPAAWIVYALVPFPEEEGFLTDPKNVGIDALTVPRAAKELLSHAGVKGKAALLHSVRVSGTAGRLVREWRAEGLDVEAVAVSQAPLMEDLFSRLKGRYSALLLLPDPVTDNPYRLRFIVTESLQARMVPLALDCGLASQGVALALAPSPQSVAALLHATAQAAFSDSGYQGPKRITADRAETAGNKAALAGLGIRTDLRIDTRY
ncbi:MAG: hypothetical protein AB1347_03140 [Acidobacteriota bacterium]